MRSIKVWLGDRRGSRRRFPGDLSILVVIGFIAVSLAALISAAACGGRDKRSIETAETQPTPRFFSVPRGPAHLVFSSNRDGDVDLYASSQDGLGLVALTRNTVPDENPVVSPDGRWIAVTRGEDAALLSAAGRLVQRLPHAGGFGVFTAPKFSPDSRWLAVQVFNDWTERAHVERIALPTLTKRRSGFGSPLSFSPDSQRLLVLTEAGGIAVLDLRTGARHLVFQPSEDALSEPEASWSPTSETIAIEFETENAAGEDEYQLTVVDAVHEGAVPHTVVRGADLSGPATWIGPRTLVYTRTREPRIGDYRSDSFAVDVDDGAPRVLASNRVGGLAVSPDGSRVLYVTTERGGAAALNLRAVAQSSSVVLLRARAIAIERVAWSPSGRRIAVVARKRGQLELLVIDVRASNAHLERRRRIGTAPSWDGLFWSPNERAIAYLDEGADLRLAPLSRRRLRSVANAGTDGGIVGWARGGLTADAPAPEPIPSIDVVRGTTLHSRGEIVEITADGERAVALVANSKLDCRHFVAWNLRSGRLSRFDPEGEGVPPGPCEFSGTPPTLFNLTLKGTKLRWSDFHCGISCYVMKSVIDVESGRMRSSDEEEVTEAPPVRGGLVKRASDAVLSVDATGTTVRVRRVGRSGSASIVSEEPVIDLELTSAGLFYAFNTTGAQPGNVVFVSRSQLFAMLGS